MICYSGILITHLSLFGSSCNNMTVQDFNISIVSILMLHFFKMFQVGTVTAICVTCFLIRCVVVSMLFPLFTDWLVFKEGRKV